MTRTIVKMKPIANTPLRKKLINETVSSLLRARSIALSACELVFVNKYRVNVYQDTPLCRKMARIVDNSCMREPGLALAAKIDKPYGIVAQRTLIDMPSIPVETNLRGFLFFHHNYEEQEPMGLSFLARPLSAVQPRRFAMKVFGDTTRSSDNSLIHSWMKLSGGDPFAGAATMASLFQLYVTENITSVETFDPDCWDSFSYKRLKCSPGLLADMLVAVRTTLNNVQALFAKNDDGTVPSVYVDSNIVSAVLEAGTRKRLLRFIDTKESRDMEREFRGAISIAGYVPTSVPQCEAHFPTYSIATDDTERYDTLHTGTFSMTHPYENAVFRSEKEFDSWTHYDVDRFASSFAQPLDNESPRWPQVALNMAIALRYIPDEYLMDMPRYAANVEKGCLRIYRFMNATRGIMAMQLLQTCV